jgi:hypothetical protein
MCAACGRAFQPGALAPTGLELGISGGTASALPQKAASAGRPVARTLRQPTTPASIAQHQAGHGIGSRLGAVAVGFFTPILLLAAMAFVASLTGRITLCQVVLRSGSSSAFELYVASTRLGFLVWTIGPPVASLFALREDDSGAGFIAVPVIGLWLVLCGAAFLCWSIAAARYKPSVCGEDVPPFSWG